MNDYKEKIIENYRKLFYEYGEGPSVGQWSFQGQQFRFEKLTEIGQLSGSRILEIGCGLGDFFPFLGNKFNSFKYTGIDMVPELIESARNKHSEASFLCLDLFNETIQETFDYVFISGVFNNVEVLSYPNFLFKLISIAFNLSEKAIGFNFTSTYVNHIDEEMAYHNPTEVLRFCIENLSKKVILSHHYERCDVSVFVYR